jgi:hypothetical protein
MGNWTITIHGTGIHHNRETPADANRMAKAFVSELIKKGHSVEGATFTHGGRDDLLTCDYSVWDSLAE